MKKFSKRVLSVVLSVLLVMTSFPLFAFSAFAADNTVLLNAVNAYEAKMDGTVYTNMSAAYQKYMAAIQVLGDNAAGNATTAQINAAANELREATNNMGTWGADGTGYAAGGTVAYGSFETQPTGYSNILYADGSADTQYDTVNGGGKVETSTLGQTYRAYFYFYYPDTTIMYDGKTEPVVPVMLGLINKDGNYSVRPRWLYPTGNDFAVRDYWIGYNDNFVWPDATTKKIGYDSEHATERDDDVTLEIDNKSTYRTMANYLYYQNRPTATLTTIDSITWAEQHSMNVVGGTVTTNENKYVTTTKAIHIINYKKLITAVQNAAKNYAGALRTVDNYKFDGGLANLLAAFDAATDTDPNSFFTSSNDYQSCADWIDTSVATFSADATKPVVDAAIAQSEGAALNAMSDFKSKLATGVYKNLEPVYQAYVDCKEAYDSYEYGTGSLEELQEASAALEAAVDGMEEFTGYNAANKATIGSATASTTVGVSTVTPETDAGLTYNYSQDMANVLYAKSASGDDYTEGARAKNGSWLVYGNWGYVYYPETTLLYDGITAPTFPIVASVINKSGNYETCPQMMYNTNHTELKLLYDWVGYADELSWPTNQSTATKSVFGTYTRKKSGQDFTNKSTHRSHKNMMQYQGGKPSSILTTISSTAWYYEQDNGNKGASFTADQHSIYIVDISGLVDAVNEKFAAVKNIDQYDEGGMINLIKALDAATGLDVNSYFTSSNNASGLANKITELTNALNAATYSVNTTDYEMLRLAEDYDGSSYDGVTYNLPKGGTAKEVYEAGQQVWSDASWTRFENAMKAAHQIMDALPEATDYYAQKSAARAAGAELVAAYNALESFANFEPVDTAIADLKARLDDKKYTAASLDAINTALGNLDKKYYAYTEEQRNATYADENEAIEEEAAAIDQLNATAASLDTSALDAAIEKINTEYTDPDAYDGLQESIEAIQNTNIYRTVNVAGKDVIGFEYADKDALDAHIQTILSITDKYYDVTVVQADGTSATTSVKYGAEFTATSNSGASAWTYDYYSNTSNSVDGEASAGKHETKFLGTSDSVTFIVKGNTTVTAAAPTSDEYVKITFKSSVYQRAYNVFYVKKGTTVDPAEVGHPAFAFYTFNEYSTGAFTANADTTVIAEYTASGANTVTIYFANITADSLFDDEEEGGMAYYDDKEDNYYDDVEYNDMITISEELLNTGSKANASSDYIVNDETRTIASGKTYARNGTTNAKNENDVYAFAIVTMDDLATWRAERASVVSYDEEEGEDVYDLTKAVGTEKLVAVGTGCEYTFRAHEDVIIIPYTLTEYTELVENTKVFESLDVNGAGAYVRSAPMNKTTAISIIGDFVLPDGAELVESGILIAYTKDGSAVTDKALTLANVDQSAIYRLKSTNAKNPKSAAVSAEDKYKHQYVINLGTSKWAGCTVNMKYRAYTNYTLNGTLYTVYSETVSASGTY